MDMFARIFRGRTLAGDSVGRRNSIGFLRLMLAASVVVSHSRALGYEAPEPGAGFSHQQTDLGKIAVFGFFVLSGYLISGSALRSGVGRYLWHRFLRIFPGLWVCLLLLAFVMAPLVFRHQHGDLAHFWRRPDSPFHYLEQNWWSGVRQIHIGGLSLIPDTGIFDGALWSLSYEMLAYLAIAVLSVTTVLKRSPRFMLFVLAAGWLYMLHYEIDTHTWREPHPNGMGITIPLLGTMLTAQLLYLGFMFVLGVVAQLYKTKISTHGALAAGALVVLVASLKFGGFAVFGMPAFGYLVLWLAVRLPAWFHKVGRKHDYSYGLYIYGWPIQVLLVMAGVEHWGVVAYALVSIAASLAVAVVSWHLVERPAMRLKDWTPPLLRRRGPAAPPPPSGPTPTSALPAPVPSRDAVTGETASLRPLAVDAADIR